MKEVPEISAARLIEEAGSVEQDTADYILNGFRSAGIKIMEETTTSSDFPDKIITLYGLLQQGDLEKIKAKIQSGDWDVDITQNLLGEWVPSIPDPYQGWLWKHCVHSHHCEQVFWTMRAYQSHYAICHILRMRRSSRIWTMINCTIFMHLVFSSLAFLLFLAFI